MNKLSSEQPPGEDESLKEWLTRLVININGILSTIFDLEHVRQLPEKIVDGMLRYFPSAMPPEITYPGPWVVIDGVWQPMTLNPDGYLVSCVSMIDVADYTLQNPTGVDVVAQIKFGPASGTPTDEAMVDANGAITINYDGWVELLVRVNVSRSGSSQSAAVILSYDVNGVMSQRSQLIRLFSQHTSTEFTFFVDREFAVGDVVKFYQTRDSSGTNDGGLYPFTPALPALGAVPSATLKIHRQIVEI